MKIFLSLILRVLVIRESKLHFPVLPSKLFFFIFGFKNICFAFVHLPETNRCKLDSQAQKTKIIIKIKIKKVSREVFFFWNPVIFFFPKKVATMGVCFLKKNFNDEDFFFFSRFFFFLVENFKIQILKQRKNLSVQIRICGKIFGNLLLQIPLHQIRLLLL